MHPVHPMTHHPRVVDCAAPAPLLRDLHSLGRLFESMVVRDLRVYAQAADAAVFYYREKGGLEVDAIVQAADGRWAAFAVKLGEGRADDGAPTSSGWQNGWIRREWASRQRWA